MAADLHAGSLKLISDQAGDFFERQIETSNLSLFKLLKESLLENPIEIVHEDDVFEMLLAGGAVIYEPLGRARNLTSDGRVCHSFDLDKSRKTFST